MEADLGGLLLPLRLRGYEFSRNLLVISPDANGLAIPEFEHAVFVRVAGRKMGPGMSHRKMLLTPH
jgi:hypothetical protein